MKTKMGRPKMPKGTAKAVLFAVKIAANEVEKIQMATGTPHKPMRVLEQEIFIQSPF
jgi:hypothetical protein